MLGILLILLSTLCLAFQNVVLKVIFSPQDLFGLVPFGGWLSPNLPHSVLLYQMRNLVVMPAMAAICLALYPATLPELKRTLAPVALRHSPAQRRYLLVVLGASTGLFCALVLLFTAISLLSTGIAVTLFFIHPTITNLLLWGLTGIPPGRRRLLLMGLILLGMALATPPPGTVANWFWGTASALGAGGFYASYTILTQQALRQGSPPDSVKPLNPLVFSLLMFGVNLALASISLLLVPIQVDPQNWPEIWVVGTIGAMAAMVAYILNNFGIQKIGAARASLIGSATPILTTLLAWLALQEVISAVQAGGILGVTVGIAWLSWVRPGPSG